MAKHPAMRMYYQLHIDDKAVTRKRVCQSFVQAMARIVLVQLSGTTQGAQSDVTGASININTNVSNLDSRSAADAQGQGIQVGTGTTAVATSDTKLQTRIITGSGAGQLRYLAQVFNNFSVNSTDTTFQLIRSFVNNSGGSITVNEIGLYSNGNGAVNNFCLIHDIIGGGVVVPATKTLTVTYTFSFPA